MNTEELKEIPEWIIAYDKANYQSSAGRAVRFLMERITQLTESHKREVMEAQNDLTPFGVAQFWYLKGFKDAETTERQPVSIEQTMKDARVHFAMVWESHKNTGEV